MIEKQTWQALLQQNKRTDENTPSLLIQTSNFHFSCRVWQFLRLALLALAADAIYLFLPL